VIAQVNSSMPRVHGDTFIRIDDVDFIIPYDEQLLEYKTEVPDEIAQQIGKVGKSAVAQLNHRFRKELCRDAALRSKCDTLSQNIMSNVKT